MSTKGSAESYVELRGSISMPDAITGKSAYEIAVMQGFKGTVDEWLKSLENGPKGDPGVSCTHEWDGTTLKVTSASGTSSADLKGEKGDKGDKGDQGPRGIQGVPGERGLQGEKGNTGPQYVLTEDDIDKIVKAVLAAMEGGSGEAETQYLHTITFESEAKQVDTNTGETLTTGELTFTTINTNSSETAYDDGTGTRDVLGWTATYNGANYEVTGLGQNDYGLYSLTNDDGTIFVGIEESDNDYLMGTETVTVYVGSGDSGNVSVICQTQWDGTVYDEYQYVNIPVGITWKELLTNTTYNPHDGSRLWYYDGSDADTWGSDEAIYSGSGAPVYTDDTYSTQVMPDDEVILGHTYYADGN